MTFPTKETKGEGCPSNLDTRCKMFTPKQMLHRLPIALAQVKAGNTTESLPN